MRQDHSEFQIKKDALITDTYNCFPQPFRKKSTFVRNNEIKNYTYKGC